MVSDRAVFSSLDRFARQRLEGYYTQGLRPALGEERFHLQLMDWSLGTACCCHDVHNSLKWALAPYGSPQDLHDLRIVVESLRNSFSLLTRKLPSFMVKYVAFRVTEADTEAVRLFWSNMGVEPNMLDEVAEVNPWWQAWKLSVSAHLSETEASHDKVALVLLYLCKWRRLNDSRWATMGSCCRSLLWGCCTGLEAWVAETRSDDACTDFFLHGFARLNSSIKRLQTCLFKHKW